LRAKCNIVRKPVKALKEMLFFYIKLSFFILGAFASTGYGFAKNIVFVLLV
jgi:hypothetical protein